MEDAADNHEESAPKRSRSNEEIKADKDVFSSSDSGQQRYGTLLFIPLADV